MWLNEAKKRNPNATPEWINEFRCQAYELARPMQNNGRRVKKERQLIEADWNRAAELATQAMKRA